MAGAQTGTGKTGAFALPTLQPTMQGRQGERAVLPVPVCAPAIRSRPSSTMAFSWIRYDPMSVTA